MLTSARGISEKNDSTRPRGVFIYIPSGVSHGIEMYPCGTYSNEPRGVLFRCCHCTPEEGYRFCSGKILFYWVVISQSSSRGRDNVFLTARELAESPANAGRPFAVTTLLYVYSQRLFFFFPCFRRTCGRCRGCTARSTMSS